MKISFQTFVKLKGFFVLCDLKRFFATSDKIDFSDELRFEPASPSELKGKPPVDDLGFGKHFTDHMLRIKWTQSKGWEAPVICKLQNMEIHPAAKVNKELQNCKQTADYFAFKVLHYAQELFEGMKAYRGVDNEIRMFRPMHNMTRMLVSARRSCLPTFEPLELVHCIRKLIQIEQEWVPHTSSSSLYLRPTMIGTPIQDLEMVLFLHSFLF